MHPSHAILSTCLLLLSSAVLTAAAEDPSPSGPASAIDLRPQLENLGLRPRLQGARPTCSVFTVASALEFAVGKQLSHTPRLSVDYLNWAANQAAGDREDGGFFSDLWKGFAQYGICTEQEMPYQDVFQTNRTPSSAALAEAKTRLGLGLNLHWIKEWDVNTGLTPAQLRSIKETLQHGWPVCGGFRWPKREQWDNEVLQMAAADAVRDGHSVLLVGYRDASTQPGGGVFLFRNTSHEGRDGAMPYAYAAQFMNDAVWIGSAERSAITHTATLTSVSDNPLNALTTLSPGRNRRISSNEQPKWNDANLDMTVLPPGKAIEMPLLKGPGMITHIWMTSHAGRANELNALTLRIYWDDRSDPGVEVPLGDFFAVGQGTPAVVESVPVQVSPTGALSCFWRMPFAKSARIVVSNDNPDRTTGLYWQIDWVELEALPPDTAYFHARYRQEYPAVAKRDYLIADLQGQGQYVGTVMSVTLGQDGWWGEGDDFFYIDGESVPSLQGTGSEDYFNDAWGFRPRTSHWFGQPRWQGDDAGDSGVCYRWHVLDPVAFSKSLKVTIEHKGNYPEDIDGFFLERPDFLSSVAFWYQTGEPKHTDPLPPYPARRVPWINHHLVREFRHAKVTGTTPVKVETTGMFGARPVLSWTNSQPTARLTLPFTVDSTARYAVRLTAAAAPDFGDYQIELDGQPALPSASFHSGDSEELDLNLGTHELAQGSHTLSFRALPSDHGRARPMAVEMLHLLRLPRAATRTVKTHHEAHFVRLAIGRAVYAYRLAYGQLPESLNALVETGLMPARFLNDENNRQLRSHREADSLVVDSDGPEPWTYRWQGLDARR